MIKINAPTIEQALLKASNDLNCSCIDLEYEIVQYPSDGIFGIGKKEAQIIVSLKNKPQKQPSKKSPLCAIEDKLQDISKEINELFKLMPLNLEEVEVSKYNANTILIHFKGADSALLIGEKGYRYKALSYLLFNWINPKYGLNIRLEIERFLANQEEIVKTYLAPIIQEAKQTNKTFETKILDGVLVYIALKILRCELPHKHIAIKANDNDENFIVIE